MPTQDQVVIVTGAGKGLGRAYALYLGARGARVVVNNRRHATDAVPSADRTVEKIMQAGGRAVADYTEVECPDSGAVLLQSALENYGRLDAVIANAGVSEGRSFHKQDLSEFARVVDINLMGTVNLLQPVFRYLYERNRGSILISTSVAGLYGEHGLPAYSASKAALIGLMMALSQEGRSHNVRVNALAPFAQTQMTEASLPPALENKLLPDHVAPFAAWLVSEACTLNGQTLIAGGGRLALARSHENQGVRYDPGRAAADPDDVFAGCLNRLHAQPMNRTHDGSVQQFMAFAKDLM